MPRISKEGSEIPRAPEGGMYDAKFEPHITHFTFQKFRQKEKFLEMFKIAQLLKRKVF